MQVAWAPSARSLLDRAHSLAVERGARVTTLHLAAAMIEDGGDGAMLLTSRGVRGPDLRSAARVHPEEPGTWDRVRSAASRIAAARAAGEAGPVHLLAAALGEDGSALSSLLAQLGCDPSRLADDVLRVLTTAPGRASHGARGALPRGAIIHGGGPAPARTAAPAVAPASHGRIVASRSSVSSAPSPRQPVINAPAVRDPGQGPTRGAAATSSAPSAAPSNRSHRHAPARPSRAPERTEHDLDGRTFPALSMFARNLSADGARGTLDPVVGRERERQRVLDAIGRREGRGAIVVGPAGVGKSTLLRALARETPTTGRIVLLLRHAEVCAQARGQQGAERVRKLVEELCAVGDRVLVALDPIAPWFLTRDAPDDVVLELRAALSTGRLGWVGTATADEAKKLTELEPWIERASVRVDLEEPREDELRAIVRAFAPAISAHHGVVADAPVLDLAAELSERYLAGRAQPDRALSVIDLALARTRRLGDPALSRDAIAGVVSEIGGVPVDRVDATDGERLLGLEKHMADRIVGHGHAIARVAQTLRRNAVGFRGSRPIGTFLFLGPTGVGKTETAKAIADALFPGSAAMTRFDMAEYAEAHAVARLVGAPPGYVGYQDGGQLTEAVRRKPYQLILLDEIEKAHRDVLESLLALLDEGRMTDGRGRTVDFTNTVVVMTSNLGAELCEGRNAPTPTTRSIGFARAAQNENDRVDSLTDRIRDVARASLPLELWNRIDEPVVFAPLTRDEVTEIAWRLLRRTFARLEQEQGVQVVATPGVVDLLLDNGGYEPSLGARPMRRAIARLIEGPLAEAVLRGTLKRGDLASLVAQDWGVQVRVGAREASDAAGTPGQGSRARRED